MRELATLPEVGNGGLHRLIVKLQGAGMARGCGVKPTANTGGAGRVGVRFRQLRTLARKWLGPSCATSRPEQSQQTTQLLDHLVGAHEQCQRDTETQRIRRLKIDDKLDFRGLLHRQV